VRDGTQSDAREDRRAARRLRRPERLAERDGPRERADERLQVHERAGQRSRHACLRPREQPEGGECAEDREAGDRGDGRGRGRRRRHALRRQRDRQRDQRGAAELDRGHGRRVAAGEQLRLDHDERRRSDHGRQHERIARERRPGAAGAGDQADAGDPDERPEPGERPGRAAPGRHAQDRDQHRHGADDQRGVADAGALDPGVLEQDHDAVAGGARGGDARRERGAQPASREPREQRRRESEADGGEPGAAEPLEAELGQRHREPPQDACGDEGEDRRCTAVGRHGERNDGSDPAMSTVDSPLSHSDEISFRRMPFSLDEIDVRLLGELQTDADRPNVELARIVGLSPAATLNRVRRLKESGVIREITARIDSAAAGFSLQVFVLVTLARHEPAAERRFAEAVHALPQVIAADSIAGEVDAILQVVARDVEDLQVVLSRIATRGATRIVTLLRLGELKHSSPLPLRAER
jgi:Lrp/AsnC family leucine-responsive transcriptional regulator